MGGFNTQKQSSQGEQRYSSENFSGGTSFSNQDSGSQNWANQQAFNQAGQQATSQTSLYGGQAPFLQSLWGQANALSGADPGIAAQARNAWGQAIGAGINPGVADVIANASADMGLNFSRNTLPGIRQGAVGSGSLGGSRQGIAEGLAAGELARNQSNMATTLYTQALDQASRERTAALSMSGAMQNLPWQGLESFARVVGAPVMESYGSSFGSSSGGSTGASGGTSFGTGRAGSESDARAWVNSMGAQAGSGSGWGFNVGGKGGQG